MVVNNPNENKPFDEQTEQYGIRNPNTPDEELVDLKTGKSNHTYYRPEEVLNPQGCEHYYVLTDVSKREYECRKCGIGKTFLIQNIQEEGDRLYHFIDPDTDVIHISR